MTWNFKSLKFILPVLLIFLLFFLVKVQKQSNCTGIPTPATLNSPEVTGSTVNLSWTNGQNNQANYLNVATSNSLKPDGSLLETDIINDQVTDKSSYLKSGLKPGTYYWNIVSDNCKQRKVSKLSSFTIQPSDANCELKPAVLGTPVIKDSTIIFNWTNDQNAEAVYINVASSNIVNDKGVLQKADIANDIVSGQSSYTKENLSEGTYYWNIASDGCGERQLSELGTFTVK